MQVVDVSRALTRLDELPRDEATLVGLADAPGWRWELLVLPVGQAWSAEGDAAATRSALVLEGVATWRVAETRQSLASGHLLIVPAGAAVSAVNDGVGPMSALLHSVGGPARGLTPLAQGDGEAPARDAD